MSVIKVKIQKDFTIICNAVLEDPNLSFKAKGLWAYCMSRPHNWQFHVTHLATVSKEGLDAVYSAISELKNAGLIEFVQPNKGKGKNNGRGCFEKAEYVVYPYPQDFKINLPHRENPDPGNPDPGNPPLTSTEDQPRTERQQNPPPPSSGNPKPSQDPPPTKEEEEEIARRFKERPSTLPKVNNKKLWDSTVLKDIRREKEAQKVDEKLIEKHRKQAMDKDMTRNSDGWLVCACKNSVEFTCGSKIKIIPYNLPDEEWIKQTGWN